MQVPTPLPTDNLYKFLALSGVALLIVIQVLAHTALAQWVERADEAIAVHKSTAPAAVDSLWQVESLRRDYVLLRSHLARLKQLNWFACALTAVGFFLWYFRVQVHEDTILRWRAGRLQTGDPEGAAE